MSLLALDTSGEYAVLALVDADTGTLRAARVFAGRRALSQRLLGEVQGLLAGEGLSIHDVGVFAVGVGPGSFTGVRVGVTTAKMFAQVSGKPLVAVPTMDGYVSGFSSQVTRLVVLPSRRGEAYAAVYAPGEDAAEPFAEDYEQLTKRLGLLEAKGLVLCCGAVHLLPCSPVLTVSLPAVPPEGLARVAVARFAARRTEDPWALVPLYVVPPAISTPKDKRV